MNRAKILTVQCEPRLRVIFSAGRKFVQCRVNIGLLVISPPSRFAPVTQSLFLERGILYLKCACFAFWLIERSLSLTSCKFKIKKYIPFEYRPKARNYCIEGFSSGLKPIIGLPLRSSEVRINLYSTPNNTTGKYFYSVAFI